MDQKPHDIFGVSLCRAHHDEQHSLGVNAFDRKYGIDLWALAAEFALRSPDGDMRATLKFVRPETLANA
jgi:Putative HNHc nuclease